ncbi:hypothetical protein B0T10DRAFT_457979 [Thelonectria olida]|uniref:Ubiquitin-like protease family profile domain-containing protein n=1 Tax=Thelonectria olida TaxID=1576542 RepID=A0A9P8W8H8_9HYPO|nr:hypothetical protein B0T10DRAFT_457979 [Thelonectria olida]
MSSLGPGLKSALPSNPSNPFSHFTGPPPTERPSKRQKVEESHKKEQQAKHISKYFASKPQGLHCDDIQDVSDSERPPPRRREESIQEVFDLTHEGSQADTVTEIISVTSTGKTHATTAQEEYRIANPGKVPNRRIRKSRALVDGQNRTRQHLSPGADSIVVTSPDVLQDDPPLTNVVSDILPRSHTAQVGHAGTKGTKRMRHSAGDGDESPDELANTDELTGKRVTNFSGMQPAPKRPQRGDIQPSNFLTSKLKFQGPTTKEDVSVSVSRAASGSHVYPQAGQADYEVRLRLKGDLADVIHRIDGVSRQLAWLEIQASKILTVSHYATHSPIVIIKRSATNHAPGQLALEFETVEDAVRVVSWVPSLTKCVEESEDHLSRVFEKSFEQARSRDVPNTTLVPRPSSPPRTVQKTTWTTSAPKNGTNLKTSPPTEKLKDRMLGLPPSAPPTVQKTNNISATPREGGMVTRRTRQLSPTLRMRDRLSGCWTELNPEWDKDWRMRLEFPANGRKRESVEREDVARLDEGEFLNDNLINFYLRYLQADLEENRPEILQKVHFFNTFLFPTIKAGGGNINYNGVAKWTAKVDLFSYKYIVVPINENMHWYLAIIYNAPKLLPESDAPNDVESIVVDVCSQEKPTAVPVKAEPESISLDDEPTKPTAISQSSGGTIDPPPETPPRKPSTKGNKGTTVGAQKYILEEPKIITLDSLGSPHSITCKTLRNYLKEEAKHKKDIELVKLPPGMTAKHIPAQDNHCDCGAFLLGYVEEFLKNPDEAVRRMLQKEKSGWNIDASQIRTKVRSLILSLQKEYQAGEESRKMEEKRKRRLGKAAGLSGQSSPREAPARSSEMPSPMANGIRSPVVAASIEPVLSAPVEPKPGLCLEEPGPPSTPRVIRDPQFVQQLDDGSSVDSKTPMSGEAVHSARASPEGASQIPVDLTTEGPTHPAPGSAGKRPEPKFVQGLPSSSTSPEPLSEIRGVKRSRSESPEVSLVQVLSSRPPKAASVQPRSQAVSMEVLPSIEGDKATTHGPQYDGIDHSHHMVIE